MQMLAAGGMTVLADGVRESDDDNPAGYYEFEPVKRTRSDASWVASAVGKAVKVVYLLLMDLPAECSYRVIFMRRDLNEVVASQQLMLQRLGKTGAKLDSTEMASVFQRQLAKLEQWLKEQPSFEVLFLNYRAVVSNPQLHAESICRFLGTELDVTSMCAVVNPQLYRQRSTSHTGRMP
jgi:hypothetical protein